MLMNSQRKIDSIMAKTSSKEEKLQGICDFLESEVSYYDWVGFYFKNGNKNELKLAQFTGEETEHTIIPFGKGICGQVALSNENFVVSRCFSTRQLYFLWLEGEIRNCYSYFCRWRKYWPN